MTNSVQIELAEPHDAQWGILEADARFKVLCCGRRFGKTELFIDAALNGHSPNTRGALDGYPISYVAMTYDNVLEFWRRLLATLPEQLITKKDGSRLYLELATGGIVECWTYENFPAGRGRAYAGMILDEAAQSAKLKQAWEDVFRATLLDYLGWALIGSTPNGFNFFHDLFDLGWRQSSPEPGSSEAHSDWLSFQFTSYDNPYNNVDEIETIKSTLPRETFKREYLAMFTVTEGSVFTNIDAALQCKRCGRHKHNPEHRYVAGIDWGRKDDYTVLSIIDKMTDTQVYLDRWRGVSWESICRYIVDALIDWQVEKVVAEANAMGDTAIEMLRGQLEDAQQQTGVHVTVNAFTMTNRDKTRLVDQFKLALEKGAVSLLPDDNQALELRSFIQSTTLKGSVTFAAAGNGHDDIVIALLLSYHAALYLY